VEQVPAGQECRMTFADYQNIREGDETECFNVEIIKPTMSWRVWTTAAERRPA
jgi:translation initiation factor IF-2